MIWYNKDLEDIRIDMLSLGNADSIIVWLKGGKFENYVILIDGGNRIDGEKVISHLNKHILPKAYKRAPDLVICTHHDKDHIGGLIKVVDHYGSNIGRVWINNPAEHMNTFTYRDLKETFRRQSQAKQYKVILEAFTELEEFISIVDRKGIRRECALYGQGLFDDVIKVLGPSDEFYKALLPDMGNVAQYVSSEAHYAYDSNFGVSVINESSEEISPCPIVDEENSTSAINNSSVILKIDIRGKRYLFTGDAGVRAFEDVERRYSLKNIYWLDVPHHGSRRNLTSRLIATMSPKICFISAIGSTKHPRRALVNCLKRHGAKVSCTKDGDQRHELGDRPRNPRTLFRMPIWHTFLDSLN